MASAPQSTVNIVDSDRKLGGSSTATIAAIYSQSPIHTGQLTRDKLRKFYKDNVLNAVINDNGHTFGTFNTSYNGAPDISSDVETGGSGLPASPHVPNPVSPGVGSINPTDQSAAPEGFGTSRSDVPGSGAGSTLEPKDSSAAIAAQDIDTLPMGLSSE